jgi:tetratricopeptide (TPR) repeat protein
MGCTGSKKMVKKGQQLEEAGLYQDASDFYYSGLIRNSKNVKAIIGLKKTGQLVLDDKLEVFYKAYSFDKHKNAVYAYIDAQDYYKKVKAVKVELKYPSYYEEYYKEVKEKYLTVRYQEGLDLIDALEYNKAESIFKEILKIDPEYKEALAFSKLAYVEPYYQMATAEMKGERYRAAYYHFDEVTRVNKEYKDALSLRQECKEAAIFTIAIVPYTEQSRYLGLSSSINKSIANHLTKSKNPFIVIVDRQNTDKLIEEQKLALSGIVDSKSAASAGMLLGVKAVLFGQVTTTSTQQSNPKNEQKTAYEYYSSKAYNSTTGKHYTTTKTRKVYYTQHSDRVSVSTTYEYQLISSETGEVLSAGFFTETATDAIRYSTYKGDYNDLYPQENTSVNSGSKKSFDKQFTARKHLKSYGELAPKTYDNIAKLIAADILVYEKRRD